MSNAFDKSQFRFSTYHVLFVGCEFDTIITVGDSIALHPLTSVVFLSLGLNSCHLCFISKIHLQPLIVVIISCRPCTSVSSLSLEVQSPIESTCTVVIFGGSCYLCIGYVFVLHTERV